MNGLSSPAVRGEGPLQPESERGSQQGALCLSRTQRPAWDMGALFGLGAQEVRYVQDAERLLGFASCSAASQGDS